MNLKDCKMILTENDKMDMSLSCDIDVITKSTLTQKEWAEKLGVSEATISSWISAQKIPAIAEKAIQYELLKATLKKYESYNCKSILVEKDGKFLIYSAPSFNFEDSKGKLIAETTIPSIARFVTMRRSILQHLNKYREELDEKLIFEADSSADVTADRLFDLEELLYYIQTGKSRMDAALKEMEPIIAEKNNSSRNSMLHSKELQEYTKLQIIPDGTKLRMIKTKGKSKGEYYAQKVKGCIIGKSNKKYYSLSGAAIGEIGFGSWNGWTDWDCFDPRTQKWIKASLIRKKANDKKSDKMDEDLIENL